MGEKKRIKIEDKNLRALVDKMVGFRLLVEEIAQRKAELSRDFWERAKELYGLDLKNKVYRLWFHNYEIEEV